MSSEQRQRQQPPSLFTGPLPGFFFPSGDASAAVPPALPVPPPLYATAMSPLTAAASRVGVLVPWLLLLLPTSEEWWSLWLVLLVICGRTGDRGRPRGMGGKRVVTVSTPRPRKR